MRPKASRASTAKGRERRQEIIQLQVYGLTHAEIGRRLGISQVAVTKHIQRIEAEYKAERLEVLDVVKQRDLARLDALERQAWVGWFRSLKDKVQVKEEDTAEGPGLVPVDGDGDEDEEWEDRDGRGSDLVWGDIGGGVVALDGETGTEGRIDGRVELVPTKRKREVKRTGQSGNPAFLEVVLKCMERRAKLLGLDQPMRIDIEMELRLEAERHGLDPDDVVAEAEAVMAEAEAKKGR